MSSVINDGIDKESVLHWAKVFKNLAKEDPDFLKQLIFNNEGEEFNKFKLNFNELVKMHNDPPNVKNNTEKGKLSSKKGKLLENLTRYLLLQSSLYSVKSNLRNNTNEIDLLLQLNDFGDEVKDILPECMHDDIVMECKNYDKNIGVTWVGKFASLLDSQRANLGVIFSYNGLAGRNEWDSSKGLVKKIYLRKNVAILNFYLHDFELIINGTTFPEIIQARYNELKYHTNIDEFITKHPAEVD